MKKSIFPLFLIIFDAKNKGILSTEILKIANFFQKLFKLKKRQTYVKNNFF